MIKNNPTVDVLGIPIFNGDIPTLFQKIGYEISSKKKLNRQISLCDANVLVTSKKNRYFKNILKNETYLNLADGMPGVWVGKLKGAKNIDRCYGPDVFKYIIKKSSDSNLKHYFTGGKEGVAENLRTYCFDELGNSNIVGVHCPPFTEMSDNEITKIAEDINESDADIVWIGISSPKQDIYAHRLKKDLNAHFIFTIGAAFDFYTGNITQAPKFIQRSGFEWLFRLIMEPKRLWKRYFTVIPLFIYFNLLDFFFSKKLKSQ